MRAHLTDRKPFRAKIPIPSRLTPGAYTVEVDAIRNGEVVARAEQPLTVKLVGFPALLAGLPSGTRPFTESSRRS